MSFKRTCPKCESQWNSSIDFCAKDGTRLGVAMLDRYELVRSVAQSGMSEVFEARHTHTGRRVALKLLRSTLVADDDMAQRMRREGRAASAIGDPNIIDITDFGKTDDGEVYMVMEWIDGNTVREILDRGPLPPLMALEIASRVAQGLEAAHLIGIVHRDIKPENVMVFAGKEKEPRVKILDFGIAKLMAPGMEKLTHTGTIIGTPAYMSPEQARGEAVDPRSDIYSLGCMLYDLFTGTSVFNAPTPMELVYLHAKDPPELPSKRAPDRGIPPDVDALIMQCLEKDRQKRPASMSIVKDKLLTLKKGITMPAAQLDAARTMMFRGHDSAPPPHARQAPPAPEADLPIAVGGRSNWGAAAIILGSMALIATTTLLLLRDDGKDDEGDTSVAAVELISDGAPAVTATTNTDAALARADRSLDAGSTSGDEEEGAGSWQHERKHSKFRIRLTASPRPLMPREPIELSFQLSDLKDKISWAVTEGRLRAEIKFVHFVRHDTLGSVAGSIDDRGNFRVIFSVPQTGKYHLQIKLTDGSRVVGRTQMDLCVGIDPDSPDVTSLCPKLNEFTGHHGPAR
jgi:tRNA A-37 threonylcarbamoyl transferase component Bud32